ncbi:MAG: rhomboid family intramembrane serine protease [Myxococcota bacterium]
MFFFPFGDEPNSRETPFMNYALIAANVLVFVLITMPLSSTPLDPNSPETQDYIGYLLNTIPGLDLDVIMQSFSAYEAFTFQYGFRPGSPTLTGLFSSMFLHGDFWHLAGNMVFLWIYGDNVEHRLGSWSYLLLYLLCGVAATLTFGLFALGSQTPLVGASGAIFGALGLYFVWFPRNQVKVFVWIFIFINIVRVPARVLIGFYLIWHNLVPVVLGVQSSTAFTAHIGGALAGMGIAWAFDRYGEVDGPLGSLIRRLDSRRAEQREAGVNFTPIGRRGRFQVIPGFGGRAEPPVLQGVDGFSLAIARDNMEIAFRIFAELDPADRAQIPDSELMRLADHFTDVGDYDSALSILQRFIGQHQSDDRAARAHLRAGLIHLHFKRQPVAAAQHFHAVLDMHPSAEMEQVVRNALAQIES